MRVLSTILIWVVLVHPGYTQEEDDNLLTRTGPVSFSREYKLADDFSYIIFKIKNHNSRSLSQIFGWVYRISTNKEGTGETVFLVNNPHRGGLIVKGQPHRPGKVAHWRFRLDRNMETASVKDRFVVRVSNKGVFFPKLEPSSPSNLVKGKKKTGR